MENISYGIVRDCIVSYVIVYFHRVTCDMVRYCVDRMVWSGIILYGNIFIWHRMVSYRLVEYGIVWYGMKPYGVVSYPVL